MMFGFYNPFWKINRTVRTIRKVIKAFEPQRKIREDLPWWTYKKRPFPPGSKPGATGFVYLISFTNGKKYIGYKFFDDDGDWFDYCGSGFKVKQLLDEHGYSCVRKRTILAVCYSAEKLKFVEADIQKRWGVIDDPSFLNLRIGDDNNYK